MGNRQQRLVLKRQALLLKIQAQRSMLGMQCNEFRQSMAVTQTILGFIGKAGNTARRRPLLGGTILAAVLILKPRRVLSMAKTALMSWQIWNSVKAIRKNFCKEPANP